MSKLIKINEYSKTPKYRQIINSVVNAIEAKTISVQDRLPSVNRLLIDFDISRDTIVRAYDHLKKIGLVESVPGKGYFLVSNNFKRKARIFLLFNKLSAHKKIIYDAFSATLGDQASIDFYIYNNDFRLFKKYILGHLETNITHFVIIPHFIEGGEEASKVINLIPKHKLILLDKLIPGIEGDFGAIYQDFEHDIYLALNETIELLRKYQRIRMIFPPESYHAEEILVGFSNFCVEYAFDFNIISDISSADIRKGDVFVNLRLDDLVTLIKRVKEKKFVVGSDVGIISYNETPLKEVLLDGITVISTDFQNLGQTAARMILKKQRMQVANPFRVFLRNSL